MKAAIRTSCVSIDQRQSRVALHISESRGQGSRPVGKSTDLQCQDMDLLELEENHQYFTWYKRTGASIQSGITIVFASSVSIRQQALDHLHELCPRRRGAQHSPFL